MPSEATIKSLVDTSKWAGGWYQDIIFPDGSRTVSSTVDFDKTPTRGLDKWGIIEPFVTSGRFLDIGCNAGAYLVQAAEYYDELYGIEYSPLFLKQCRFVLKEFGVKASLINGSALDIPFGRIPYGIDTTIMVNTLYWLGYSDIGGYIPYADHKLYAFMERLSLTTKDLITVGCESVNRIGGKLDKTVDFVAKHFHVVKYETVPFPDRTLNYIYARS